MVLVSEYPVQVGHCANRVFVESRREVTLAGERFAG